MKSRSIILIVTLGLILPLVSGCVFTPDLDCIQRIVATQIEPATMKTQVKLNLGPVALSLARMITGFANVEDEVQDYLSCIKRVELNVQEISGLHAMRSIRWPKDVEHKLKREGWETLVKAKEEDEITFILYKTRKNRILSLYVINLNLDELVLVKVEGRLDTLITRALENHGFVVDLTADFH
ncbi:MAG: DUF4252 domain-containing protein [Gemmatimonadota bacterium]|nr:MAG: DUF4252 domain-containing protein [Gemmatimonadota bacterium]